MALEKIWVSMATRVLNDTKTQVVSACLRVALRMPWNAKGSSENGLFTPRALFFIPHSQEGKNSLKVKFLGRIFLGHKGPRRRDIPDKNFMQVASFFCFRQGVAGTSRDLGWDVPDWKTLYKKTLG